MDNVKGIVLADADALWCGVAWSKRFEAQGKRSAAAT
jgi:hypothetical protein